ncbi:MAG: hypothetical protein R2784_02375 [Saprospiraceae bacterium]
MELGLWRRSLQQIKIQGWCHPGNQYCNPLVMSFEGCMDTIQKTVELPFIDVDLSPLDWEVSVRVTPWKIMATNNDPDFPVTCTGILIHLFYQVKEQIW